MFLFFVNLRGKYFRGRIEKSPEAIRIEFTTYKHSSWLLTQHIFVSTRYYMNVVVLPEKCPIDKRARVHINYVHKFLAHTLPPYANSDPPSSCFQPKNWPFKNFQSYICSKGVNSHSSRNSPIPHPI